jgi:uncharacterized protein YbjT (DUF2867 family)
MFTRLLYLLILCVAGGVPAMAAPAAEPVLLFGATGQLGSEIARELVAAGHPVTAFVRAGSDRSRLGDLPVQFVVGDLLEQDDVTRALAGARYRIVIDASARGGAADDFYPRAMRHIVTAARAHGAPRILLHGSVGAGENMALFPQAPFGRMAATLAAKGEAEKILEDSGLDWAIIRNGILMPAGTPATGKALLSADQRLMRSVTRADLARLTVECLAAEDCFGHVWHAVDESLPFPDRYR